MSRFIYAEYSMKERVEMLKRTATKSMVETYNRSLSDEEIDAEKDRYTRDAIEYARQKDAMDQQVKSMKQGMESIKTLMEERLECVKTGQKEVHGMLYGVPDHSANRMNFYDQFGENINSRDLTPDERQTRMFIGEEEGEEQPYRMPYKDSDDDGITDVDFVETIEEEEPITEVEQKEPEEDKPKSKKKAAPKKPKPKPKDEFDEDDLPI